MTGDYAEVYKSTDGWRWRLKGGNHEVIATGEAYKTKWGAKRGVRKLNPNLVVKDL